MATGPYEISRNVLKATGGTNWQKYLPPKFQKRMFFPELWSEKEIEEWGIAAVKRAIEQ
jgi:tryptophan 2,3-dioxygenase